MPATLTSAMLADLHKGNAAILLKACPANGEVTLTAMDFSAEDKIFTIKDSFNISQAEPTITEIKIDQGDDLIDTDAEKGEWTLTGKIPSNATALYDYFYTASATAVSGVKGDGGKQYAGKAYFSDPKEVVCSILVESQSRKSAVLFARVKLTVNQSEDDNANPMYLNFKGTVLKNLKSGVGDFAILPTATTISGS